MILPRRAADAEIIAGDVVRLVGEPSASLAAYDPTWLREAMFTVRYVGDDATVDVQLELIEDYVIETVPIAIVRPRRRQPAAEPATSHAAGRARGPQPDPSRFVMASEPADGRNCRCECTEARRFSSPFGRDCRDGGVWPTRAFAGPLQALNFREAGSRQSLGELVNGPAIGGHDLVIEGGDLVTYEDSNH